MLHWQGMCRPAFLFVRWMTILRVLLLRLLLRTVCFFVFFVICFAACCPAPVCLSQSCFVGCCGKKTKPSLFYCCVSLLFFLLIVPCCVFAYRGSSHTSALWADGPVLPFPNVSSLLFSLSLAVSCSSGCSILVFVDNGGSVLLVCGTRPLLSQ